MNMRLEPLSGGRVTFCGSGGGSDCIASRVLPDGKIGISSSHDDGLGGDREPRHAQPGQGTGLAELAFDGHEVWQFARAVIDGTADPAILAAIDADLERQPA